MRYAHMVWFRVDGGCSEEKTRWRGRENFERQCRQFVQLPNRYFPCFVCVLQVLGARLAEEESVRIGEWKM
jgi:hypothetical protein